MQNVSWIVASSVVRVVGMPPAAHGRAGLGLFAGQRLYVGVAETENMSELMGHDGEGVARE
jgi:hypothetical protein